MTDTGLEVGLHDLYIFYIWIIEAHSSFPKPCEYIWMLLHTRNINSTFLCMSCFVWESNHIKIKSLQWSCCSNDLNLTVPSQRHESMADRLIYLVRNGTWPELLFLLTEPMLSHVLTFLHGEFKCPSWHGVKARHQQLASQWSGEPAVITKISSKILQGGQRIIILSKLRHLHSIAWCVAIKLLKTIHTQSSTDYLPKQNLECLPYGKSHVLWKRGCSWVPLVTS